MNICSNRGVCPNCGAPVSGAKLTEKKRAARRFLRIPKKWRKDRPRGLCNAKHPRANFWCLLAPGHRGGFHTAGLEDWEMRS